MLYGKMNQKIEFHCGEIENIRSKEEFHVRYCFLFPALDQGYQGYPPQQPTIGFANPGYPGQEPYPGEYRHKSLPEVISQHFLFTGQAYPQPNPYQPPQQPGYDPSGKPLNPPYMDENDPNYKASGFGFDDKSIRAGFIRRVYSILSVS
jgi:protein lifeguard